MSYKAVMEVGKGEGVGGEKTNCCLEERETQNSLESLNTVCCMSVNSKSES